MRFSLAAKRFAETSDLYRAKTPGFVKLLYGDLVWNMPREDKTIYLTFDDGPIPEVTPFVLDTLKRFDATATFFCIGDNVRKFPKLFKRVIDEGHTIGNHTEHHLNGWKTALNDYCANVDTCNARMETRLFRPPYGRITRKQVNRLKPRFKIIMWDVLSADYDISVSPEKCLSNVVDNVENGSIVVFHDSVKAQRNLTYALPRTLEKLHEEGYTLKGL